MTIPGKNVGGYQEPFLQKPPPLLSLRRPLLLIRSLQICPAHVPCDLRHLGFICVVYQQRRLNHTFPHSLSRVRGAPCMHMCHCCPDSGKEWELAELGALRVSYCQTGKALSTGHWMILALILKRVESLRGGGHEGRGLVPGVCP